MTLSPLIIAGALAVVLALAVFAVRELFLGWEQQRALVSRTAVGQAERRANRLPVRLDNRLRRTQLGRAVEKRIIASGVKIRLSTFLGLLSIAGLLTIYAIGAFLGILFGVVAAVGVGWLFFRYLQSREDKRREEFISQLPELARVLSNATSAGLAMRTAIEMGADELDEPARAELRHTAEALKVGQPTEEALRELGERLPSRELSVLVSTLLVSSRAGGSLVTALRNISTTLEGRKELRREVKTTFAQSVFTGYLVAGMGIGTLFLLNAIAPGSIEKLTHSVTGVLILASSFGLFALGLFLVNRVTRIDV